MILAFDTSAAHCAAVLLSGDAVVAARHEAMARGQAERLLPMLQEMLEDAGLGWRDLTALGVGTGPGNFTGLRVAVAAARGLALSTGLPAFGVDGFVARAEGVALPALVAIAAPRDAVHVRRVDPRTASENPFHLVNKKDDIARNQSLDQSVQLGHSTEIATVTPDEARRLAAAEGLALVGDAVGFPPPLPLAEAIARIARRRLLAGEIPARPAPLYVRPPDAAPARDPAPTPLP